MGGAKLRAIKFHKNDNAAMWYFDIKLAYHPSGMYGGDGP
jgi:hypothetical protein